MSLSDLINGLFEICGGFFIALHCIKLYRQKMVRGVSIPAVLIFVLWGFWNLYYYPHLGQWWSFVGGVSTVLANSTWVGMMLYYIRRERRRNRALQCLTPLPVHPMCRCVISEVVEKPDEKTKNT